MSARSNRLFVYGSLRRGEPNHCMLDGCALVGEARTAPAYALVDLGPYPALTHGAHRVHGEVYEVSPEALARLDRFEGHPWLFRRDRLSLENGDEVEAYFGAALSGEEPEVSSGDWKTHRRRRT